RRRALRAVGEARGGLGRGLGQAQRGRARASEQVRVWLEAGRARALEVLAEHAKPGSKNRKVQNDWFAWAQLRPLKTPEDAKTLYVGVSIGTTPALLGTLPRGTTYCAAYVATAGGASARADLC